MSSISNCLSFCWYSGQYDHVVRGRDVVLTHKHMKTFREANIVNLALEGATLVAREITHQLAFMKETQLTAYKVINTGDQDADLPDYNDTGALVVCCGTLGDNWWLEI